MVKINPESGPEYKYEPYKPIAQTDTIRHKEYVSSRTSEYKPRDQGYEYKPYKPSHVGIYGEKTREKKTVKKRPPTPQKRRIRKPRRTFKCYGNPMGPDIKAGDIGPEYNVKEYHVKDYKPTQTRTITERPRTSNDMLKSKQPAYIDRPFGVYNGNIDYKINEKNNAGMRHWSYDYVDDTVSGYRTEGNRQKYKVEPKPKPEPKTKSKKEEKPEVAAAVLPVQRSSSPPRKKTFTTSSTQHVGPVMQSGSTQTQGNTMRTSQTQYDIIKTKSLGTQFEPQKTNSTSIQTSPTHSPMPAVVAPIVHSESPKKVKTRSEGVQCSEERKRVTVRGTQSDGPSVRAMNTQTSPMPMAPIVAQAPVRERTPYYAEEARQQTPVYRKAPERRSPSPTFVPIVAAASHRRSPTPKQRTPTPRHRTPTPKLRTPSPVKRSPTPRQPSQARPTSYSRWSPEVREAVPVYAAAAAPPHMKAYSPLRNSPAKYDTPRPEVARQPSPKATTPPRNGPFPYASSKPRLPPEVTACIEAYDCAHIPHDPTPSVHRSLNLV